MAKHNAAQEEQQQLAVQETSTALATIDLEEEAGSGMENVGIRDMSIPFLKILQDLSPEIKKSKAEYIEGSAAGLICNTVTKELAESLEIVPCFYQFVINEWKPNRGGYVATHQEGSASHEAAKKSGNDLVDTANWYVLIKNKAGQWTWGVIAFTMTALKPCRSMLTRLQSIRMQGKTKEFTPPFYFHIVEVNTVLQTKDNNEWFNWKLELAEKKTLDVPGLYEKAREYYQQVSSGAVKAVPPVEDSSNDVY